MNVFFYGLFMDEGLLRVQGLSPADGEKGFINGYELRIGERALLIENENEKSFGVTFSLNDTEVEQLYSAPSVKEYKPIDVPFTSLATGKTNQVQCYNLPASTFKGSNAEYATKLGDLLTSLEFPADYVNSVIKQAR